MNRCASCGCPLSGDEPLVEGGNVTCRLCYDCLRELLAFLGFPSQPDQDE